MANENNIKSAQADALAGMNELDAGASPVEQTPTSNVPDLFGENGQVEQIFNQLQNAGIDPMDALQRGATEIAKEQGLINDETGDETSAQAEPEIPVEDENDTEVQNG